MARRSPEVIYNKKRSDEGDDLERYAVPYVLERDGYGGEYAALGRSHLSRGPFDWLGVKRGQILVISSRLMRRGRSTPSLTNTEAAALWRYVELLGAPGTEVLAVIASAEHAPTRRRDGSWGPCRCSPRVPVEQLLDDAGEPVVHFWRMASAPVAGRGHRPDYEPWSPDFARAALPVAGQVELEGAA